MANTGIIVVGDSHYAALRDAALARGLSRRRFGKKCTLHIFDAWHHKLLYPFHVTKDDKWVLNPKMAACVTEIAQRHRHSVFVSMFAGSHNHALAQVRHQRPFDVSMSEIDRGRVRPDAELVSQNYMRSALMAWLPGPFQSMALFAKQVPCEKFVHIDSPSFSGDDDWSMQHLDQYFIDNWPYDWPMALTDRKTRLKVKLIQSQLFEEECERLGYTFISAPRESLCDEGFLKPEYCGSDTTHANKAYGELVLQSLEAFCGRKITAVETFQCEA